MRYVGFIPSVDAVTEVIAWTRAGAQDGDELEFVCLESHRGSSAYQAARAALGDDPVEVTPISDLDLVASVVAHCRAKGVDFLLFPRFDLPGHLGAESSDALLAAAPCRALVLQHGTKHPADVREVMIVLDGTAADRALVQVGRLLREGFGANVTLGDIEADIGRGAEEVGRIALQNLMHEEEIEEGAGYAAKVVVDNHPVRAMLRLAEGADLVLVGNMSMEQAKHLESALGDTALAFVKREPPLTRRRMLQWIPRINPSDYAELVQDLRRGSHWHADFVVMLALASAIATLGLLQNSPAVVIGSMLLAPLMTPMIGFGLALVQANERLIRLTVRAIVLGFALTLFVSFLIALISPGGETLSAETLSRGQPNVLDLLIALFAGAAAAYSMARPGISGAVAGVAIATALVPPVCSVGIALAYGYLLVAGGAATLFLTNLIAIVLSASLTYFAMGVRSERAFVRYRRLARRVFAALGIALLALSVPLGERLGGRIAEGHAQPLAYPLTRALVRQLHERVDEIDGAQLMFAGRSSKTGAVVVYVATDDAVERSLATDIQQLVRTRMEDDETLVEVVAVRRAWQD